MPPAPSLVPACGNEVRWPTYKERALLGKQILDFPGYNVVLAVLGKVPVIRGHELRLDAQLAADSGIVFLISA